jgi:tRNA-Thr(GGU) m(6)t(6)A37 methyltransferase TsaA
MAVTLTPIGTLRTTATNIPRHWSLSDVEGTLEINPEYTEGLKDILPGQEIVVLFHFHKSQPFSKNLLTQTPPHKGKPFGVFSICSPRRPNPIGLSVLKVTEVKENKIYVKRVDMLDGTPILDIKPHIINKHNCPSYK